MISRRQETVNWVTAQLEADIDKAYGPLTRIGPVGRLTKLSEIAQLAVNGWVAVFETTDGPSLEGPFASEAEAFGAIIEWLVSEMDMSVEDAKERYETSDTEWITRLGVS